MKISHPIFFQQIPNLKLLSATFPGLKGLFFDMDGTLFNTEPYHEKAFLKIGLDHKIRPPYTPDVIYHLLMGKADYLVYEIVKDWENFPKHWSVEDFVTAKNNSLLDILSHVDPRTYFAPKISDLLRDARAAGWYLALVTSSEKLITKKLLELTGLSGFFDLELTREDCLRHKPDPWPYLHAIKTSHLLPKEILIFEDSPVGLESASTSGAHTAKVDWYYGLKT